MSTPTTQTPYPGPHVVPPPAAPPLSRPRQGRWIAGVCAGLADRFGMTPAQVRVLAVVSCLLPGPQVLAYVALWALMPARDH